MKETTKTIKKRVMVFAIGPTEAYTRVTGSKASSTEYQNTPQAEVEQEQESGLWVTGQDGFELSLYQLYLIK